jgi:hypothetical protein
LKLGISMTPADLFGLELSLDFRIIVAEVGGKD